MQSKRILNFPKKIPAATFKDLTDQILILSKSLQYAPLNSLQKQSIFHTQFLKSSLFSARIEGNQLTLSQTRQADLSNPKEKNKKEISNILKALNLIKTFDHNFNIEYILQVHRSVMDGLEKSSGKFRSESSAIFDQNGNVVYLTPEPNEMKKMLNKIIKQINTNFKNDLPSQLYNIANCHYFFEKIHPFIDGNGRTGRIILQYMLSKTNLFDHFLIPIEEYFDEYKSQYYYYLEKNSTNNKEFVKFFLEGIIWSLKRTLTDIKNINIENEPTTHPTNNFAVRRAGQPQSTIQLLPRRQEILNIIKDHPYITVNAIARRFPTIPKRTISYDVQQLLKKDLVNKHGQTRGVMYTIKELV